MIYDDYHPYNSVNDTKSGRWELFYIALSEVHDFYSQHNYTSQELNNMEQAKSILVNVRKMYDTEKDKISPVIKIFKNLKKSSIKCGKMDWW